MDHTAENDAGCGGCRGIGAHRRYCPRHPDYHPWRQLADRAEGIGDSIGVPELANRAWALAGAIREAMPDHPYRRVIPSGVTAIEDGCTCGGMAACQQCQDRDAARVTPPDKS